MYGSTSKSIEVYDPGGGNWCAPKAFPTRSTIILPMDVPAARRGHVHRRPSRRDASLQPDANPIVDDPAKTVEHDSRQTLRRRR